MVCEPVAADADALAGAKSIMSSADIETSPVFDLVQSLSVLVLNNSRKLLASQNASPELRSISVWEGVSNANPLNVAAHGPASAMVLISGLKSSSSITPAQVNAAILAFDEQSANFALTLQRSSNFQPTNDAISACI